jgi:hypothetical protein
MSHPTSFNVPKEKLPPGVIDIDIVVDNNMSLGQVAIPGRQTLAVDIKLQQSLGIKFLKKYQTGNSVAGLGYITAFDSTATEVNVSMVINKLDPKTKLRPLMKLFELLGKTKEQIIKYDDKEIQKEIRITNINDNKNSLEYEFEM